MKKLLCLLLAVVLSISFIACGDNDDDDGKNDGGSGEQTPGSGEQTPGSGIELPNYPADDWD